MGSMDFLRWKPDRQNALWLWLIGAVILVGVVVVPYLTWIIYAA
jgi:hypothetical protein